MGLLTDRDQAAIVFDHILSFAARVDLMSEIHTRLLELLEGAATDDDAATARFFRAAIAFVKVKESEDIDGIPSEAMMESEWAEARRYADKSHHGCLGAYCEGCDGKP
jgi:hypothetical protein